MSGATGTRKVRPSEEWAMVVAISLLVYAVTNFLHEGVGHAGACLLGGGKLLTLSTMHFDGSLDGRPDWAGRLMAAGGTLANFTFGMAALGAYQRSASTSSPTRYFLWLLATLNLMQASGYFLFSGLGGLGDWMGVIYGLPNPAAWRVGMALFGLVTYPLIVRSAVGALAPFLGSDPAGRFRRAGFLLWVPYFTGASLYVGAGLLNPAGVMLVAISAAASSLGGCSGLLWGVQFLRNPRLAPSTPEPLRTSLSWPWLLAALAGVLFFILVLGPGIRF